MQYMKKMRYSLWESYEIHQLMCEQNAELLVLHLEVELPKA